MSSFKGKLFLVKGWLPAGNTANNNEAVSLTMARVNDMSLSQDEVDISTKATDSWRELGSGMGLRSLSISLEGVFSNTAIERTIANNAIAGNTATYLVVSESGETWKGSFFISEYQRTGNYNSEETYSFKLSSAGVITYTQT